MNEIEALKRELEEMKERIDVMEIRQQKHFNTQYGIGFMMEALLKTLPRFLRIEKELARNVEDADISDLPLSVQRDVQQFLRVSHKSAKRAS